MRVAVQAAGRACLHAALSDYTREMRSVSFVCCLSSTVRSVFCLLAACLSLFIILFMVLVPKEPAGGSSSDSGEVYDHTANFRKATVAVLGILAFCTLLCVCQQIAMAPVQASRIRSV